MLPSFYIPMNEFIQRFAEMLGEGNELILDRSLVFKEHEDWSSMKALVLIAMVDEHYGVLLEASDIQDSSTLLDLYNRVEKLRA